MKHFSTDQINIDQYQKNTRRTLADQKAALQKLIDNADVAMPLLQSIIGKANELGELAGALHKWIWYNRDLDVVNLQEEFGDDFWFTAAGHNALNLLMSETLQRNEDKLRKRYAEKFTEHEAAEENRDRDAERKVLEFGDAVEGGCSECGVRPVTPIAGEELNLCATCYEKVKFRCDRCEKRFPCVTVRNRRALCADCAAREWVIICTECHDSFSAEEITDGLCPRCYRYARVVKSSSIDPTLYQCVACGSDTEVVDGLGLCALCAAKSQRIPGTVPCNQCRNWFRAEAITKGLCPSCFDKLTRAKQTQPMDGWTMAEEIAYRLLGQEQIVALKQIEEAKTKFTEWNNASR